jgi:hypothetical protein
MKSKREYLVTRYDRNANKEYEIRVPKSANIRLLVERLICLQLDKETLVDSCLRKNSKRAYDPFQIMDFRDELRREQAKVALNADPETNDPMGTYHRARAAAIPVGKTLIIAGNSHEIVVKEINA